MIKKICSGCGKIIERKYSLCPECAVRMTSKRNKEYNAVLRNPEHDAVYRDTRWTKVKPVVHLRDNGLCRQCFDGKIYKASQLVHHIVEPEEDLSLAYEPSNLISLCESCHQKIHSEYRAGRKRPAQDRLRSMIKKPMIV